MDVFGVAYGKKSLEEILFKMLLRKKYNHHSGRQQIKSLRKSQLKMRSNTSLLGRVLFWIASEMLEILTKILGHQ